ncbi:unnamed protein product, partial [Rotaria magnacalcarata]
DLVFILRYLELLYLPVFFLLKGIRRPLNPLAKPDIQLSFVSESLGSAMPAERN